ncbi:TPA: hypothetical protein DCZ15_03105 [Candidatus Falkowbacteria bacterium]|nr:MAG: hypothetical protein UV95_C0002G0007 [Candidatus Falkowbacteria bacterium GW2011_GWF2_43_32]HBA36837.1 hypothetical protein [Candidatus Falkowbacteria bacterium]
MPILKTDDSFLVYNRDKCRELINKGLNNKEDIMQFLLSLHIVLEVGINSFFRALILVRRFGGFKTDCIDQVSFIDKITMFFYLPYSSGVISSEVIEQNRSAISKLKSFAEVRNKLMHGHINAEIFETPDNLFAGKIKKVTATAKLIHNDVVIKQISDFKFIVSSLSFFINTYWDSFGIEETKEGKRIINVKSGLIDFYLNGSFLNI